MKISFFPKLVLLVALFSFFSFIVQTVSIVGVWQPTNVVNKNAKERTPEQQAKRDAMMKDYYANSSLALNADKTFEKSEMVAGKSRNSKGNYELIEGNKKMILKYESGTIDTSSVVKLTATELVLENRLVVNHYKKK